MTIKLKAVVFSAALAVGGMTTAIMPSTASAMTLNLSPMLAATQGVETANSVEKVGHRRTRRHRRAHRRFYYSHRRHGRRYRHRRGRHVHYHNGYYYAAPFWLGALAIGSAIHQPYYHPPARRHSRHVRWCLNRYRSYRPATDTFRGYDGYDHRCRSPYHR